MIIWYPANFMPVVKKQSHLCVTSIIITSGLFITMNNEHSLCLWQCSLHNLTNGFSLSSGRLSYEVHEFWLRTSNAVVWTDNGSKLFLSHGQTRRGVSLHCAAVTKMLGVSRVTCPPRVGPHVTTLTVATSNIPPTRSGPGVKNDGGLSTPTSITSTVHSHIMVHLREQMIK